jgi:hypothetical protein
MAAILINENGDVLVDGAPTSVFQIKNNLKPRIFSKIDLPSNRKLIVSVKTDRRTSYNIYIQALDQIKLAYYEVRDEYSNQSMVISIMTWQSEIQDEIKEKVPIIISIAEPERYKR